MMSPYHLTRQRLLSDLYEAYLSARRHKRNRGYQQRFERTFIADSYSCIVGRGTLYGVHRLEQHIRQESQNYTEACYVLKKDIRGYFMGVSTRAGLQVPWSRQHCR